MGNDSLIRRIGCDDDDCDDNDSDDSIMMVVIVMIMILMVIRALAYDFNDGSGEDNDVNSDEHTRKKPTYRLHLFSNFGFENWGGVAAYVWGASFIKEY